MTMHRIPATDADTKAGVARYVACASHEGTLRAIEATARDDGNYGPVVLRFAVGLNHSTARYAFVAREDLETLIAAPSQGGAYWRTFRRKYKPTWPVEEGKG